VYAFFVRPSAMLRSVQVPSVRGQLTVVSIRRSMSVNLRGFLAGWRSASFQGGRPSIPFGAVQSSGRAAMGARPADHSRGAESEMAVPRVRGINPSRLTCWNEPDSDGLCHDGALVSDDVHVLATVVNKRHPC
jgi:hypothetical protein